MRCFGSLPGLLARRLGGQVQDGEDGPGCGDAAGDERAGGEAAQERVGGRQAQRLAEGRMADPGRADEMVATAEAASLNGWRLGETVRFGAYTVQQANSPAFSPATAKPAARVSVTLVGLVVFPVQVARDARRRDRGAGPAAPAGQESRILIRTEAADLGHLT